MSATTTNERLAALTTAGTSVWLDQLSRGLIESGELKRMVEHESLFGVTSNPAILEKAILGSSDYDDDLRRPSEQGKSAREIYRAMALHHVRAPMRCDLSTTPRTASRATSHGARPAPAPRHRGDARAIPHVLELVDRPNLMIKIPTTAA